MAKDNSAEICPNIIINENALPFIIRHQDPELNQIVSHAYQQSGWVRQAICDQQSYYQQVYFDQNYLLQLNQLLWNSQTNPLSTLQSQVLARIDQDYGYVQKLNKALAPSEQGGVTWSLKTNKMEDILLHAREIVANETNLAAIVQGEFPLDLTPNLSPATILGDMTDVYGNSKATYLNAALVEVNLVLSDVKQVQEVFTPEPEQNWVDQSAIVHVTPIPDFIAIEAIDPQFSENFSFFFSDEITPQGLAFIHSGYAFGGHRFEERYPEGKHWGPEDCSSWLAKFNDAQFPYSTIDQLFTYRLSLPEAERGYIDPAWLDSPEARAMQDLYSPVIVHDPFTDIQPGQIFSFRKFADEDHTHSGGISGHTGLVLGVRENGNVVILCYARNMPDYEGFGIQEFPWQSNDKMETMFFNIKDKDPQSLPLSPVDIFTDVPDIFGDNTVSAHAFATVESHEYALTPPPLPELALMEQPVVV